MLCSLWRKVFGPREEPGYWAPPIPDDASHEQMMEFAALIGAIKAYEGEPSEFLNRAMRSYREKWHPDVTWEEVRDG